MCNSYSNYLVIVTYFLYGKYLRLLLFAFNDDGCHKTKKKKTNKYLPPEINVHLSQINDIFVGIIIVN